MRRISAICLCGPEELCACQFLVRALQLLVSVKLCHWERRRVQASLILPHQGPSAVQPVHPATRAQREPTHAWREHGLVEPTALPTLASPHRQLSLHSTCPRALLHAPRAHIRCLLEAHAQPAVHQDTSMRLSAFCAPPVIGVAPLTARCFHVPWSRLAGWPSTFRVALPLAPFKLIPSLLELHARRSAPQITAAASQVMYAITDRGAAD